MKILHVIDSGGLYGAEMVLLNLVAEQMKQGLEPVIASIGEKGIQEKPLETEGIKRGLKVIKFRMLPGPNLPGMLKVLRYAQKHKFNILHSHGYKGDVAFGLLPRRLRRIALVSTLHGWTSTNGFSKNSIYEWLQKMSLKHIDAVVLVNKGMLSNPRLGKIKRVNFQIVNNGIPILEQSSLTQQTQRIQSTQQTRPTQVTLDKEIVEFCQRGYTVCSIGRLSKEKGFHFLMKAVALLNREGLESRLVIIGEGGERKSLEDLACKLGLDGKVLLPGYCDEARRFLRCFSVYAISSVTEGLPITLLEAMAARIPIVACAVGGISEVLDQGRAGLLTKAGDPASLAAGIRKLLTDRQNTADLIAAAHHRVCSLYSSQAMAREYSEIYGEVLSSIGALRPGRLWVTKPTLSSNHAESAPISISSGRAK